jgi:hypothetical protein
MVYVLVYSPPKGVERKYVLPRGGPKPRVPVVWRRRNILVRAPLHQTQHHCRGRTGPRPRAHRAVQQTTEVEERPKALTERRIS